jgi:hypothetical protein
MWKGFVDVRDEKRLDVGVGAEKLFTDLILSLGIGRDFASKDSSVPRVQYTQGPGVHLKYSPGDIYLLSLACAHIVL